MFIKYKCSSCFEKIERDKKESHNCSHFGKTFRDMVTVSNNEAVAEIIEALWVNFDTDVDGRINREECHELVLDLMGSFNKTFTFRNFRQFQAQKECESCFSSDILNTNICFVLFCH